MSDLSRRADHDTDCYLVTAKVRERLAANELLKRWIW
jgi:hypothetical protein